MNEAPLLFAGVYNIRVLCYNTDIGPFIAKSVPPPSKIRPRTQCTHIIRNTNKRKNIPVYLRLKTLKRHKCRKHMCSDANKPTTCYTYRSQTYMQSILQRRTISNISRENAACHLPCMVSSRGWSQSLWSMINDTSMCVPIIIYKSHASHLLEPF